MNRVLLAATFFILAGEVLSNPWSDDFTYASLKSNRSVSYQHADIRNRLTFTEEQRILKEGNKGALRDPSRLLMLFSGIAGMVVAGRHIRKR